MDIVGEGLQELVSICSTALCVLDVQSAHAAAKSDSFRSEFEEQAAVIMCRAQAMKLERLELVGLEDELPQGPLLKLVTVTEILDREALKAQLFSDCPPKTVDQ